LLPLTPRELLRRVEHCLKKAVICRAVQAAPREEDGPLDEEVCRLIMSMLHHIRDTLGSTLASLQLLKQGRHGQVGSQALADIQELSQRLQNSVELIDGFAPEALPSRGPGPTA
jgi:hypothetical protein